MLMGVDLWSAGNLAEFGALMNQSSWSSLHNYEVRLGFVPVCCSGRIVPRACKTLTLTDVVSTYRSAARSWRLCRSSCRRQTACTGRGSAARACEELAWPLFEQTQPKQ